MALCARGDLDDEMDTIDPMVVPPPLSWAPTPEPPTPRWRWLRWALPTFVAVVVLVGAIQVTLPYYALAPGSARQVNDLIRVPKDRSFPPEGRVLLSTVSLRQVNALEAFFGWLDPDTDVLPEDEVLGTTPRDEFTQQNLQLMDDSKQVAVVVALRRLGYSVAEHGKGAVIIHVEEGSPAGSRLVQGEVVTGVDGQPTTLAQQVVDGIRAHKPGESVRLEIQELDGGTRTEEIALGRRPEGGEGFLGVVLRTKEQSFDLPFDVTIDSGTIGGPSAGLAFALGVLDTLSMGELTGGKRVAVTGTIDIDGTVGDVGGVVQKTAAVRAAGAQIFLVPAGEYEEAKAHSGRSLEVVKVGTIDDAIAALARLGGDASALGAGPTGASG
ncbi:MAG: YlbL family protein [Acidimicrobiales bacterium]